MKKITQDELSKILDQHKLWLADKGGKHADLSYADLGYADLRDADLTSANLGDADLEGADLRDADLSYADLGGADLRSAGLRGANLTGADLRRANLSGCTGLSSPINYMQEHFSKCSDGYIVYKTFGAVYTPPNRWKIEKGSIISEVCSPLPTNPCSCGINVGTLDRVKQNNSDGLPIWKLLIKWEWLPGVVVPYNTDGEIRCEKAQLIEIAEG